MIWPGLPVKRSTRMRVFARPAATSAIPDSVRHVVGTADQRLVERLGRAERLRERPCLRGVDAALAERHLPVLAGQDVEHREAAEMAVLQVVQRLAEDHVLGRPVAVEEQYVALRLRGEHGARNGNHRRDAAAGGEQRIAAGAAGPERAVEAPVRRHHGKLVAGLEAAIDPARKAPVRHGLHGDAQLALVPTRADRIGPPELFAVEEAAKGQILALHEAVGIGQRIRHLERDRNASGGFPADLRDGQVVETRPYRHLNRSNGSRQPRQRQSALQGVEPNRLSSSTAAPPQCGQATGPRVGGAMP